MVQPIQAQKTKAMIDKISPTSIMAVERCPVANANPPVTVKQIAPAMSQRRNEVMTMTPFCRCGSAHADPPSADYIRRAPPTLIQVSRVSYDSEPTLQRHPFAPAGSNRHQSMIAQPINHSGRWIAIPEECEIPQKAQIARS
jgi:hypothetical protein